MFGKSIYFLTTDLHIVQIELPDGRLAFRDHVVNTFNERVESFIVDEDGIIHFLTNKGDIRSVSDEGKRICCAQGSNLIVKYWNKIISVGPDSFLVAGYSTDKEIESFNSLILVRGYSSNSLFCLNLITNNGQDRSSQTSHSRKPNNQNGRTENQTLKKSKLCFSSRILLYHPSTRGQNRSKSKPTGY